MIDPPDLQTWQTIAAWAGGITTVLTSIGVAIWWGVRSAARFAEARPRTERESTRIITTDTVAMQQLTAALEARNVESIEQQKATHELVEALQDLGRAMVEHTRLVGRLRDELEETRSELRELTREIVRSGRS